MISVKKNILKPGKKNKIWYAEPNLGTYFGDEEITAIVKTLKNSKHYSTGFGTNPIEVEKFEKIIAKYCSAKYAIALTNNGVAFDLILKTLNLKKYDEIIIPSLNFKAWHMALLNHKCKIIPCDVNKSTFNLCTKDLKKKISKKTIAICPVSLTGLSCDVSTINKLANFKNYRKEKIKVIYDNARGMGFEFKNKKVGGSGYANIFSLHGQKLLTTLGEGGIVTTNDKRLRDSLINKRNYGNEKSWGLNFRMSKLQAVFGTIQFKRLNKMLKARRALGLSRNKFFKKFNNIISLPIDTSYSKNFFYLYPLTLSKKFKKIHRDKIIYNIKKNYNVILSTPKNVNERWSYIKKKLGSHNLSNTNFLSENTFCVMIHPSITRKEEIFLREIIKEELKKLL